MEKGKIIFLNGVSSSGKTTLAKELQERLPETFYLLNCDTFAFEMTPKKNRNDAAKIVKALSAMHYTAKMFSDMGLNTIVDHVLFKPYETMLDECVELFHEYPVLFVHVVCPIEELRRREKERGDRQIGHAENQLTELIPQDTYDITVDTTKEECADEIIEALNCPDKFTAFKTLWLKRI